MQIDSNLVESLYDTVTDGDTWSMVLDNLKLRLGAQSAVAQVLTSRTPIAQPLWMVRDHYSQEMAQLHDSWANSPANPRFRRQREHSTVPEIGSDRRCLGLSAGEAATMRAGLGGCGLGAGFWVELDIDHSTHFTLIFHRSCGDGSDITAPEAKMLRALAPHLQRAVHLAWRLGEEKLHAAALESAVCNADMAALTCDPELNLHWASAAALTYLANGPQLMRADGKLRAANMVQAQALRSAVRGAAEGREEAVMLGTWGSDPLQIRAVPVSFSTGISGATRVLLLLSSPEAAPVLSADRLAFVLGLTPAEAGLVASLATGRTVAQHAAARNIAFDTARLHLKRAFAKTNTHRQADLVRLALQCKLGR